MTGGSPQYSRRVHEESGGVKRLSDGAFAATGLTGLGFEYLSTRIILKGKEWPRPSETQQDKDRSKEEEEEG